MSIDSVHLLLTIDLLDAKTSDDALGARWLNAFLYLRQPVPVTSTAVFIPSTVLFVLALPF